MTDQDETRELVDFTEARTVPGVAGGWILIVNGESRCPRVELEEAPAIPEHKWWVIDVAGYCPSAGGPDVQVPFKATMPYDELPAGKIGIEVVGATRSQRIPRGQEDGSDE